MRSPSLIARQPGFSLFKLALKRLNKSIRRAFCNSGLVFVALSAHSVYEAIPVFYGRCLDLIAMIPLTYGSQNGNDPNPYCKTKYYIKHLTL